VLAIPFADDGSALAFHYAEALAASVHEMIRLYAMEKGADSKLALVAPPAVFDDYKRW
jgi:hypothetical protein